MHHWGSWRLYGGGRRAQDTLVSDAKSNLQATVRAVAFSTIADNITQLCEANHKARELAFLKSQGDEAQKLREEVTRLQAELAKKPSPPVSGFVGPLHHQLVVQSVVSPLATTTIPFGPTGPGPPPLVTPEVAAAAAREARRPTRLLRKFASWLDPFLTPFAGTDPLNTVTAAGVTGAGVTAMLMQAGAGAIVTIAAPGVTFAVVVGVPAIASLLEWYRPTLESTATTLDAAASLARGVINTPGALVDATGELARGLQSVHSDFLVGVGEVKEELPK